MNTWSVFNISQIRVGNQESSCVLRQLIISVIWELFNWECAPAIRSHNDGSLTTNLRSHHIPTSCSSLSLHITVWASTETYTTVSYQAFVLHVFPGNNESQNPIHWTEIEHVVVLNVGNMHLCIHEIVQWNYHNNTYFGKFKISLQGNFENSTTGKSIRNKHFPLNPI